MLCLGSVMFSRWEKYRLVAVYESFSDFHFSRINSIMFSVNINL